MPVKYCLLYKFKRGVIDRDKINILVEKAARDWPNPSVSKTLLLNIHNEPQISLDFVLFLPVITLYLFPLPTSNDPLLLTPMQNTGQLKNFA